VPATPAGIRAALGPAALVLVLASLAWAYWTAVRAPAVGVFHDDGVYAVTAKALATGRGYRIVSLPSEIPQTKYPFLFPMLLAAVWKVFPRFPENLFWLKLVPLGCALVWGGLAYRLLREQTGSLRVSMAITGLMAVSPWVLFLSTALLSETLFAALVTGALILLERIERGRAGWAAVAGAGFLSSAAFLTRTAGITVMAAVGLILLAGRWKRAAAFALICATLCMPWFWWQNRQAPGAMDHEPYYSRANYRSWNIVLRFTPAQKAKILVQNVVGILIAPAVLMGVPATGAGALLALAVGGLVAGGFARRLARRGLRGLEIFMLLYGAVMLSWAWPPVRFVAPLLPLLLLYGYEGAQAVCQSLHLGARESRALLAALALVLLLEGGWTLAGTALRARETGAVNIPNTRSDDWRQTARMLAWLRENTLRDAVLMGNLDPVFYLYTGRKSVRGFVQDPYLLHYAAVPGAWPLGPASEMLGAIRGYGASYLICAPNASFREGPYLDQLATALVRAHPELFHLVYRSPDSAYRIYAITLAAAGGPLSLKPNFQPNRQLVGSN
jgi:hypothetical protein